MSGAPTYGGGGAWWREINRWEDDEQAALMEWARYVHDDRLELLYHTPSGMPVSAATAARFSRLGMKAGVPDLCLPVPSDEYHGLYIEMKVLSPCRKCGHYVEVVGGDDEVVEGACVVCGAKTRRTRATLCSKPQRAWLDALAGYGYCVRVCASWREATRVILGYLGIPEGGLALDG